MPRKPKTESSPNKLICTVCRCEKTLDEFSPDKRRAIGVTPACRTCVRDNKIRSAYLKLAEEKGIESLFELQEKHERNLTTLTAVIKEVQTNRNKFK